MALDFQQFTRVGADALLDKLEERGWSKGAAVGLLSNAERESGLDPHASGDNGNAYGLFQWNGPRKAAYHDFAQQQKRPASSVDTQLDFLDYELTHDYPGFKDRLNTLPAGHAAAEFTYVFERPAEVHKQAQQRASLASRTWNRLGIGAAEAAEPSLDFSRFQQPTAPSEPALDFSRFERSAPPTESAVGLDFSRFAPAQPQPARVSPQVPIELPDAPGAGMTPDSGQERQLQGSMRGGMR